MKKNSGTYVEHNVYMVYSKWTISRIDAFLRERGEVSSLRVVYDNNGKETNRTIVIVDDCVYKKLCEEGFGDQVVDSSEEDDEKMPKKQFKQLKIARFMIKEFDYPNVMQTRNLFIPIPKCITSDVEVMEQIEKKLTHLSDWDIIKEKSWEINIPVKSREKGEMGKGCFVIFNSTVSIESIALVRLLITDTYWDDCDEYFKAMWARDRGEQKSRNDVQIQRQKKSAEEEKEEKVPVKKAAAEKRSKEKVKNEKWVQKSLTIEEEEKPIKAKAKNEKWVKKSLALKEDSEEEAVKPIKAKRPFPAKEKKVEDKMPPKPMKEKKTTAPKPKPAVIRPIPQNPKKVYEQKEVIEKPAVTIADMSQPLLEEDDD